VISPTADLGYTLPTLPLSAPPSLPDPSVTPGDDRLELTLTATNNSGDAQAVLDNALGDASHFALRTIEVDPPTTGVEPAGTPLARRGVLGLAYPDPVRVGRASAAVRAVVTLPVVPAATGPAMVEIFAADGRLVRAIELDGVAGVETQVHWDGRDAGGHAVPAGTYFARLRGVSGAAEKIVLIR
jgi:hypothetical protein